MQNFAYANRTVSMLLGCEQVSWNLLDDAMPKHAQLTSPLPP
jgi:hypothetical protein